MPLLAARGDKFHAQTSAHRLTAINVPLFLMRFPAWQVKGE